MTTCRSCGAPGIENDHECEIFDESWYTQKRNKILERLDWLCDLPVGEQWSEYHWREVCQLQQEVKLILMEKT